MWNNNFWNYFLILGECESGTCCVVESNGQGAADVETDIEIDDVLRFDNGNFSSPESLPQSWNPKFEEEQHTPIRILELQRQLQNDHKNLNTCYALFP